MKEVSQNVFSSNLNTVNLKIFPKHGGIFTSRYIELWKDSSSRLIVKRFQRLCHVIRGTDMLFERLTPEIED